MKYRLKADVTFHADDKKRALENLGRYFARAADSDMATSLDLLDRPDGAIDICPNSTRASSPLESSAVLIHWKRDD